MEHAHREDCCSGGVEIDEMKNEINDLKKCIMSLQVDVTELNLEVQFQEFSRLVEHEARARDAVEKSVRVAVDTEARLEISKLKEKEMEVEKKLMEYNKNKEREIAELRTTVKTLIESTELKEKKPTSITVSSAVTDDDDDVTSELREAKKKIDVLRRKLKHKTRKASEKITAFQFKIAELQHMLETNNNKSSTVAADNHPPMLKDEIEQLRKVNSTLEDDKTDLTQKMDSILRSNSISRNELKRQIDELEIDKRSEIEKAVYLKYVNACLRYELRHYQPSPGRAKARDLNKSLSPNSAAKAKELIHMYASDDNNNDEEATTFENIEIETTTTTTTADNNDDVNEEHRSINKKQKSQSLGSKLKKLVTRRDSSIRSKGCFSDLSLSSGCKQSVDVLSENPRARRKKKWPSNTSESDEIKHLSHVLKNNN